MTIRVDPGVSQVDSQAVGFKFESAREREREREREKESTSNRIITRGAIRERPVTFLERRMSGFNDLSTWQPLCTAAHNYPQRTG